MVRKKNTSKRKNRRKTYRRRTMRKKNKSRRKYTRHNKYHKHHKRRFRFSGGADAPHYARTDIKVVLVAAHPRPWGEEYSLTGLGGATKHFLHDTIESEIKEKYPGSLYHVVTMDNSIDEWMSTKEGSLPYKPSVYDGPYVEINKEKFDMVFVPDLEGGIWGKILEREEPDVLKTDIEYVINGCLKLVKPGGYLYVGKYMVGKEEEDHIIATTAREIARKQDLDFSEVKLKWKYLHNKEKKEKEMFYLYFKKE